MERKSFEAGIELEDHSHSIKQLQETWSRVPTIVAPARILAKERSQNVPATSSLHTPFALSASSLPGRIVEEAVNSVGQDENQEPSKEQVH